MSTLPLQLQARAQWVAFRLEPDPARPDKPRKVPYVGANRRYSDDAHLLSHADAQALAQSDGFTGVGFRFTADDPFCCVDLDNCRDPETGAITAEARAVLDQFPPNAYVEVSVSGKGLHVLAIGKPQARGKSADGALEMYDRGQYVALTGNVLEGRTEIVECGDVLNRIKTERGINAPKLDKQPLSDAELKARLPVRHLDLTDAELLRLIADEQPTWFAHYIDGDVSGQRDGSKDDAALIRKLIEYVGWDEPRIESLAQRSALKRAKWEQKRDGGSWLRYTIRNLLRGAAGRAGREGEDPVTRWPLYLPGQFQNLPEPAWLVEKVLAARSLGVLFAPAETYKSFVALSLAAAVATNRPWLEEKYQVAKGTVIYIVAEGQGFFGRRLVRPQDIGYVNANVVSWDLLPARVLTGILERELIREPIKEGHFGRIVHAIPVLTALIARPNSGKDDPQLHAVLRQAEIVSRGPDYYRHQHALMTAAQLRYKVAQLAQHVIYYDGQLERMPGIGARTRIADAHGKLRDVDGLYHEFAGMDAILEKLAPEYSDSYRGMPGVMA